MSLNISVSKDIDIVTVSNGYSLKIGKNRLCNVKELKNGLYSVKCRSQEYASLFPHAHNKAGEYLINSRNYGTYTVQLTRIELEKWLVEIQKLGLNKRLDNR